MSCTTSVTIKDCEVIVEPKNTNAVVRVDNCTVNVTLPSCTPQQSISRIKASATLDFPSTPAHSNSDLTVTVTGAAVGDVVTVAPALAAISAHSCYTAWVSAVNTVTVRFNNYNTAAADPASATFNVIVSKY